MTATVALVVVTCVLLAILGVIAQCIRRDIRRQDVARAAAISARDAPAPADDNKEARDMLSIAQHTRREATKRHQWLETELDALTPGKGRK